MTDVENMSNKMQKKTTNKRIDIDFTSTMEYYRVYRRVACESMFFFFWLNRKF